MSKFRTLTVDEFAKLPSAWLDTIEFAKGVLIARIDPSNNRAQGDETVLARALVWTPADEAGPAELRRLTIRTENLRHEHVGEGNAQLLKEVLDLPTIRLRQA
ncbi:hypothetical protein QNM97_06670 [Gordonia sp. L191]|uniref:hypothetical protein n=1 Tax=Gordonia sp. L191 TaxID=2982699 RepID=UPI0024C019BC|nr:hypothetical protein [Gordonia sp. L191]WHU48672.1 hypothetical protein QNM97_06670 [Gordonia sp. L191]